MKQIKIDRSKIRELIKQGYNDEQIASRLFCSEETVKSIRTKELHVRRLPFDAWRHVGFKFNKKGEINSANIVIPNVIFLKMFPNLFERRDKRNIKMLWKVFPSFNDLKVEIWFKPDTNIHITDDGISEPEKPIDRPGIPHVASMEND